MPKQTKKKAGAVKAGAGKHRMWEVWFEERIGAAREPMNVVNSVVHSGEGREERRKKRRLKKMSESERIYICFGKKKWAQIAC